MATFAMGTALGDLTAYTAHLGYFPSAILFLGVITIPATGFRFLRWNGVFTFWFAYVVTRPLGASVADGLGKPKVVSGLGWGDGWVVLGFGVLILIGVAYLGITRRDVQRGPGRSRPAARARCGTAGPAPPRGPGPAHEDYAEPYPGPGPAQPSLAPPPIPAATTPALSPADPGGDYGGWTRRPAGGPASTGAPPERITEARDSPA